MDCSKCGGKIRWEKKGDRWYCYNMDGTDHWDDCSKRIFDDVKRTGKHYTETVGDETRRGYVSKKHGKKAYSKETTSVRGKHYRPVVHAESCNALPWEDCTCKT